MNKKIMVIVLLLLPCFDAVSQDSSESLHFDMSGFPQWTRDLRRGEIVAFGSFPFAYFFTNLFYDTYRSAVHGWDVRYAPWPVKPADAEEKSQSEQFAVLGVAAGAAITIAITDYFIVRYKRNKQQRESIHNVEPPLIIRRPLSEVIEAEDEIPQTAEREPADVRPADEIP